MPFNMLSTAKLPSLRSPNWTAQNTSSLCVALVIAIGTWRHYDTETHKNPFQQEVWIEWLSWAMIFAYLNISNRSAATEEQPLLNPSLWNSRPALWLTGAVAVASQLLSSQRNLTWILPLTTWATSLLVAYWPAPTQVSDNEKDEEEDETFVSIPLGTSEDNRHLTVIVLNLVCCVLLAIYTESITNKMFLAHSVLFLLTRSGTIFSISKLYAPAEPRESDSLVMDTRRCLDALSTPMLSILTVVLVMVRPRLEISTLAAIAHALAQAVLWYASVTLIRLQWTNTVANLDTVSLSAQMAFSGVDLKSIAVATVALLSSVTQSVFVLRPGAAARRAAYLSAIVFVVGLWISQDPRLVTSIIPNTSSTFSKGHPIENIIKQNRRHFESMRARQSTTVKEAVAEYQRRYGRRPPLGFDKWFDVAQQNNFELVDEFDTFMQTMEPFHGIAPEVLQKRIQSALQSSGDRMFKGHFSSGNFTQDDGANFVGNLLVNTTWTPYIPYNMTVIMNVWDEPMVNVDFDDVAKAIEQAKHPETLLRTVSQGKSRPMMIDTAKQNGWAATSHACPIDSSARQVDCPERTFKTPLSFVSNASASNDVCQNCDIKSRNGMLLSPGNLRAARELVPIWSASKPSHFQDVVYPSAYYIQVRGDYRANLDSAWEEKDNKFYWAGGSTGGWATSDTWPDMQRQHLVLMTSKTNIDPVQLLEETSPGSDIWRPRFSTMAETSSLFDTKISNVVQCEEPICQEQRVAFDLINSDHRDPQDAAYSHKFVFDIDGNGFSGRYYRLLKSRSVVVKQTILKEWHDDRLIPWVHYVPISNDYQELPEMARFLATTDKGLELSERIARESTQWHNKVLRDVDLQLAFFRMLLEYGRVMNPDLTM